MESDNNVANGLKIERYFTKEGVDPFDEIVWVKRTAEIKNQKGEWLFKQEDVEVPEVWSETATNIVASKYFRGKLGTPDREYSVKQLIGRVVDTISNWGVEGKYFDEENKEIFSSELKYILINQMAAFNSPIWFNVGYEKHPQCSACFINSIEDSMESILDMAKTEGMIFKKGSGSGINLSPLRGSKENLRTGGIASGPVSFMKGFDAFAGIIKSGGATRRAAAMRILNIDHPDIEEFIECKSKEEVKAQELIEAGYDGSFNGEAYKSVAFQNANHSVRVTDEFMQAVVADENWDLKAVTTGETVKTVKAKELLTSIAKEAHFCGDPGIQMDDVINSWHTSPASGRINSSNPCSEYMFLDDTACNLACLNLIKFKYDDYGFHSEMFKKSVQLLIIAQEIVVGFSSYPTPRIEKNSHDFRPLGIGYSNLGSLLMSYGIPYDSDEGRALAAAVTSLMTGTAYHTSAELAKVKGPFNGFRVNRESVLDVIEKHWSSNFYIDTKDKVTKSITEEAKHEWDLAYDKVGETGVRNSQLSVLMPAGTCGFMMDCSTTGPEPAIALVSYKKLAGEGDGILKLVDKSIDSALASLEYPPGERETILSYLESNDTIEGAMWLKEKDLPVFDCALKPANGTRSIHYTGHMKMCAAIQPFISGAISKTFNVPEDTSVQEIFGIYLESWRAGLKSVSVYRDNCKASQPLSTKKHDQPSESKLTTPTRKRLPDERPSITHKFSVAGHDGYMTVGLYEDGTPGEVFITISKEGSTISGLLNSLAESTSIALQYGVPLSVLVNKHQHSRFEPSGFTNNPDIRIASSIVDYIFRWLEKKFISKEEKVNVDVEELLAKVPQLAPTSEDRVPKDQVDTKSSTTPICSECGGMTTRNGTCFKCSNCGSTSGCS